MAPREKDIQYSMGTWSRKYVVLLVHALSKVNKLIWTIICMSFHSLSSNMYYMTLGIEFAFHKLQQSCKLG